MTHFLDTIQSRYGIDRSTIWISLGSIVLYLIAWWVRFTALRFSVTPFYIAGGILVINTTLTYAYAKHAPLLGYIFTGTMLFAQVLLLILLWKAAQGGVL